MRKILLAVWLLTSVSVMAQKQMHDMLRIMPGSLTPYLSENNKLDLIDFKDAGMKAEVRNELTGKSELLTLTQRYADFQLNEAHRMELILLDVSQPVDSCGQIICVIDTYGKDIQESTIRFFSSAWLQLDTRQFCKLPAVMYTAVLHADSNELVVTPSTAMDRPALEEQKPVEISSIKLKWINNSFK